MSEMTKSFDIKSPGIRCFEGNDGFFSSIRVLKLAEELGLEVVEKVDGYVNWIAFSDKNKVLANVSFYKPSHAYAFLLGIKAMKEASK